LTSRLQQHLDHVRRHITIARDRALALLHPSPAEREHGESLHRDAVVVDAYGFTACSIPARLEEEVQEAVQAGATQNKIQRLVHRLMVTGVVTDEGSRAEFEAAVAASGVTSWCKTRGRGATSTSPWSECPFSPTFAMNFRT